ncbi:MAG: hypothetical protein BWY11_01714 [Firmicutes bacterium ADurb.Bin182]|nr:MAG: hypothetical protein BWY11_01714 [Firmicutes bacterium ADurb.Bin182]
MKRCSIGGQAVMEGVMMKSESGIAMAVRRADGTIATQYTAQKSKAQKGTFFGLPIVRGVVAFVESLTVGMGAITKSAELYGEKIAEEPTRFEKYLSEKLGKSADNIAIGIAVIVAIAFSVGLFFLLPAAVSSLLFRGSTTAGVLKSITEGFVRLLLFLGYIIMCSLIKDVRRVFMYHGAEHKTIACFEAEEELTVENVSKHTRLHARCGTNYLFLVMAVSILFYTLIGWNSSFLLRLGSRLLFLPIIAGVSYEVLKLASKSDGIIARIVRAPGLGLQRITTKEPTPDMIEVAIEAFNLAMAPDKNNAATDGAVKANPSEDVDPGL